MSKRYRYLVRQRSSAAWTGLGAGLGMLVLMVERGAPGWTWAMVGPCIAVCVLQIALRPVYGIGYSGGALAIFDGFSERHLPLSGVDHLRLSETGACFVLRTGDEVRLPRQVLRNSLALIRETTERGIPVRAF